MLCLRDGYHASTFFFTMRKSYKNKAYWLSAVLVFFSFSAVYGQADASAVAYDQASTEPLLVNGPYLQVATSSSMVIRWRTRAATTSKVRYGLSPQALNSVAENAERTTDHIVKLSGLQPKTKYYYAIGSQRQVLQGDGDNYFITPPLPGTAGHYRIAAFGDCGNNSVNQKNVRDQVIKYLGNDYLDSWLLLGDNAYEFGTDEEYQKNFFAAFNDNLLKKYPLFPTPGNHDYREIDKTTGRPKKTHDVAYYKNFSLPTNAEAGGVPSHNPSYYSFDIGNVHFLSLDSYGKEEETYRLYDTLSPQVQWVKRDLEANTNKDWIVAYWHHPPYTMTAHNSDKENELIKIRENFLRILERYGVDLVLCGHSHAYERSRLMQGYYGSEASFDSSVYNLSQSSGLYDGSHNACPYIKDSTQNNGIVYIVSGSAGKLDTHTQPNYPHNAMYYSNATVGGALLLDVESNRLDVKWICADGIIRDRFTMMKNVNKKTVLSVNKGEVATLTASYTGTYQWNTSRQNSKSITVAPKNGKNIYTVQDQFGCVKDVFEVNVTD